MKLSTSLSTLAALATLFHVATTNFDIYYVFTFFNVLPSPQIDDTFRIFESDPDCTTVTNAPSFHALSDVSKSQGVRCSGRGCWDRANPDGIDQMEMSFTTKDPVYHWTIYKDRSPKYQLTGLDGNIYGDCILFPGNEFTCNQAGGFRQLQGSRKFRCLTKYTAQEINDAAIAEF